MTEFEPEGQSERASPVLPCPSLVNRDSATRWARRLDVELDVGELCPIVWAYVAEKPSKRPIENIGISRAMVGVCSSHQRRKALKTDRRVEDFMSMTEQRDATNARKKQLSRHIDSKTAQGLSYDQAWEEVKEENPGLFASMQQPET